MSLEKHSFIRWWANSIMLQRKLTMPSTIVWDSGIEDPNDNNFSISNFAQTATVEFNTRIDRIEKSLMWVRKCKVQIVPNWMLNSWSRWQYLLPTLWGHPTWASRCCDGLPGGQSFSYENVHRENHRVLIVEIEGEQNSHSPNIAFRWLWTNCSLRFP